MDSASAATATAAVTADMARGFDKHAERQQAVAALGRQLTRRARSACELCGNNDERLAVREVPPLSEEPEVERAVLICDACQRSLEKGKIGNPQAFRFLEGVAWSELAAVQVCAVRLLRIIAAGGADWASQTLDNLYLDPAVQEWVDAK